MVTAIFTLLLLMILIIIAIRLITDKNSPGEEQNGNGKESQIIQASGIYSIFRKSPRQDLIALRPGESEIRKYLFTINEDIQGQPLAISDKERLVEHWLHSMEENISAIEQGDAQSVLFYYFDAPGEKTCDICANHFKRGQFVTREEIFKNPSVIPPFHLGCTTKVVPFQGKDVMREGVVSAMTPFFGNHKPPTLPGWSATVKLT